MCQRIDGKLREGLTSWGALQVHDLQEEHLSGPQSSKWSVECQGEEESDKSSMQKVLVEGLPEVPPRIVLPLSSQACRGVPAVGVPGRRRWN